MCQNKVALHARIICSGGSRMGIPARLQVAALTRTTGRLAISEQGEDGCCHITPMCAGLVRKHWISDVAIGAATFADASCHVSVDLSKL